MPARRAIALLLGRIERYLDRRTRGRVLDVLDSIQFRDHPSTDWDSFSDAL